MYPQGSNVAFLIPMELSLSLSLSLILQMRVRTLQLLMNICALMYLCQLLQLLHPNKTYMSKHFSFKIYYLSLKKLVFV